MLFKDLVLLYSRAMQNAQKTQTLVRKYGGACLETAEKIRAVALDLAKLHAQGQRLVVVVSAMGKTTDELIKLAYQVSPHPNRRELDMLLTTGERISMALLSMALSDVGVPAISFTGSQAGVLTNSSHAQARIVDVRPIRVCEELDRGRIVVLAGFQGVNPESKEITTLGRGGSDTTAVAMAAALKADRCEIVKEVEGVCTGDPRIVPSARVLNSLDYDTLCDMCFWGAKVLHFRSVELARNRNVPLIIKQAGSDNENTVVKDENGDIEMESGKILSVNSLGRIEHFEVACDGLNLGFDKFAQHLKDHGLAWPQILASAYDNGHCRIMLTSDAEALDSLVHTVASSANGIRRMKDPLSSVTLTCYGSVASDLPHRVLQCLSTQKISAEKYILSSHSMTVFVNSSLREVAVKALHSLI